MIFMEKLKTDYLKASLKMNLKVEIITPGSINKVFEMAQEVILEKKDKNIQVKLNFIKSLGQYKDNKKHGYGIYLYTNGNYMLGTNIIF